MRRCCHWMTVKQGACLGIIVGGKGGHMSGTENSPPRFAGGIFIAFGLLIGAIVGVAMDQASAGTVIGMAIGTSIAVLIWVMDRKRR